MSHPLFALSAARRSGSPRGITSVCSAHPLVIEATLRSASVGDSPVLIEATCNQVNHEGGYTGMTPEAFRRFVESMADRAGCDAQRIILGGDHLGPNPWKHLPADQAMQRAETMIAAFAAAGFSKLHLDTSMGCLGEPVALPDDVVAERAARLAAAAEAHAPAALPPVYIVGTEVPVPGGAHESLTELELTDPTSAARTIEVHREAFAARGLDSAWRRVIGLVVQPGVEFGHTDIVRFQASRATALSSVLDDHADLIYEAHSTDYQSARALAELVTGGFAILKVGPWLTYAMREALYGLDAIADVLDGHPPRGTLMASMESIMLAAPANWQGYYTGTPSEQWLQRHFSLSDRIRYYWPDSAASAAVETLFHRLADRAIPAPLQRQYLPGIETPDPEAVAHELVIGAVQCVLSRYESAVAGGASPTE